MTRAEFNRVNQKLEETIIGFCRGRLRNYDGKFHMDELRTTCAALHAESIAPDSPGRILRSLRQRGVVSYKVSNRRASEYTVIEIRETK